MYLSLLSTQIRHQCFGISVRCRLIRGAVLVVVQYIRFVRSVALEIRFRQAPNAVISSPSQGRNSQMEPKYKTIQDRKRVIGVCCCQCIVVTRLASVLHSNNLPR